MWKCHFEGRPRRNNVLKMCFMLRQRKHISVVFLFTRFTYWFILGNRQQQSMRREISKEKKVFRCFLQSVQSCSTPTSRDLVLFGAGPWTSFAVRPLDHTQRLVKGWTGLLCHFLFNLVPDGNLETLRGKKTVVLIMSTVLLKESSSSWPARTVCCLPFSASAVEQLVPFLAQ